MSSNVVAWMIAESQRAERERDATRNARARELRAALAASRPDHRPSLIDRLRAAVGAIRPGRATEPACRTAC